MKYHPDKSLVGNTLLQHTCRKILLKLLNTDSKEFEEIKAAYDIVGNPVNRAMYERWKSSSLIIPFSEFAQIGTHAQVSEICLLKTI